MKDQVEALRANGVEAAFLNSTLSGEDAEQVVTDAATGKLKLLYVSPERLFSGDFLSRVTSWNIQRIAVDEAHCISFWGHDFRPEYTQLRQIRQVLPGVPMMALTATADPAIRRDILQQLEIREEDVFQTSFDRPNLRLSVGPGQKRAEQIVSFLGQHPNQAGIVYCLSRAGTEDVAKRLQSKGFSAKAYHAGMAALARSRVQEEFLNDEIQIVCATVAFGMGIDKSNVRWVIHYNLPKNLEGYYQEIGRAGRDGLEAEALLLYSPGDLVQQRRFFDDVHPDRRPLLEAKLERMKQFAEARTCRRQILLSYFGEETSGPCGHCDNCDHPPVTFDGTVQAQKLLSAVYRTKGRATLRQCLLILRGSQSQEIVEPGWSQLKTWGVGREHSWDEWMDYGTQLVNLGTVQVAYDRGAVLELNGRSLRILQGQERVDLVKATPLGVAAPIPSGVGPIETVPPELLDRLKQVRSRLAKEHEVPPYIIFSDKTLRDMATKQPQNLGQFARVHGVGDVKREHYGPAFVREIQNWLENRPSAT